MIASSSPHSPVDAEAAAVRVVILGADAVALVRPATPVQLALACGAAGFGVAVPATWGDEIVAAETMRQSRARAPRPAVFGACPHVAARLLVTGGELAPMLIAPAPPPVAAARYVRALYAPHTVHITFVGACPSAAGPGGADESQTPHAFFAELKARGAAPLDQPEVYDSVLPPDRRRHLSEPGGLPAFEWLWAQGGARRVVELHASSAAGDIAEHLLAAECVLIDANVAFGCTCSGAVSGILPSQARANVRACEPPRAAAAVVDPEIAARVDVSGPIAMPAAIPVAAPSPVHEEPIGADNTGLRTPAREMLAYRDPPRDESTGSARRDSPPGGVRRESPSGGVRRRLSPSTSGIFRAFGNASAPVSRSGESRALPRGYMVAKRRSERSVAGDAAGNESATAATAPSPNASTPVPDVRPISAPRAVTTGSGGASAPAIVSAPAAKPVGRARTRAVAVALGVAVMLAGLAGLVALASAGP